MQYLKLLGISPLKENQIYRKLRMALIACLDSACEFRAPVVRHVQCLLVLGSDVSLHDSNVGMY